MASRTDASRAGLRRSSAAARIRSAGRSASATGPTAVKVPGADESATQRARRILEELRKRLGDPLRPAEELDYLERLLRRN
jgi:hypothetical protein